MASQYRVASFCSLAMTRFGPLPFWLSASSWIFPVLFDPIQTRAYSAKPQKLDLLALDTKWRHIFNQGPKTSGKPKGHQYVLPMFPYPSGNLHLGHLRVYTIADAIARYRAMQGYEVLLPMGWDAFGLPAENAALQNNVRPEDWTRQNIEKMKEQMKVMNGCWSWDREIATCDPEFYHQTQAVFLEMLDRGLAYQAEAEVNWDPVDKTVVANEQVDASNRSWRSGALVEKKKLKQWFFKIREWKEALLEDLDHLAKDNAWPEHVLSMQRNWIGRSEGAKFTFHINAHSINESVDVFTTRPDTLYGVQYIALAANHPLVTRLAKTDAKLKEFVNKVHTLSSDNSTGYRLNISANSPLSSLDGTPKASTDKVPMFVAAYVLGDYGEGAVMGVPAHDSRDWAFWKENCPGEPVRFVIETEGDASEIAGPILRHGVLSEASGPWKGMRSEKAGRKIIEKLRLTKLAEPAYSWRLRDWLISRQRYWGTPIPILHCDDCGAVPVPHEDLPVLLPNVSKFWAVGKPGNPLEHAKDWVNCKCPQCNKSAKRDTDTMDTFVDSSWYFMRFLDPRNKKRPFAKQFVDKLPVDLYIGGIEHAILHLLYARFIYKQLRTTSFFPALPRDAEGNFLPPDPPAEPFRRLIAQGMVHGRTFTDSDSGRFLKPDELDMSTDPPKVKATGKMVNVSFEKMSKSKFNGVDPTEFISKYGADATRTHMLFSAPVADVVNWDEGKISGVTRWFRRLMDLVHNIGPGKEINIFKFLKSVNTSTLTAAGKSEHEANTALWRTTQETIRSVTKSYDDVYSLNTIVSSLMALSNIISSSPASIVVRRESLAILLRMLSPIAPAISEESWSILRSDAGTIFGNVRFPEEDGSNEVTQARTQQCAVQVNGKVRIVVDIGIPMSDVVGTELQQFVLRELAKNEEVAKKLVEWGTDKASRIIVARGGATVNYVVKSIGKEDTKGKA